MLYTVDGNDSLKRVLWHETVLESTAEPPAMIELVQPLLEASSEVTDSRTTGRGIYLTREQVDEWAKEVLMEEVPAFSYDNDNPCAKR